MTCGYCGGDASGSLRLNTAPICWPCWTKRYPRMAREIARSLWRIARGKDAVHVIDRHGETRFTFDARRG